MISKKSIAEFLECFFPSRKLKPFELFQAESESLVLNKSVVEKRVKLEIIDSVAWFLPSIGNHRAGGIVTILKIAEYLSANFGTQNYFVIRDNSLGQIASKLDLNYPNLRYEIIENLNKVPSCSLGVCTFWTTAFDLLEFNRCKKKFYLLQDDERTFYNRGSMFELVESTYRFGFTGLTNSFSIAEIYSKISQKPSYVYTPGMNESLSSCRFERRGDASTNVVVYARPSHSRNCFESLFTAISKVAKILGDDYRFFFVGEDLHKIKDKLPSNCIVLGDLNSESKIKELYAKCHFGISFISTPTITYHQLDLIQAGVCLIANYNKELMRKFSEEEVYYVSPVFHEMVPELVKILGDRGRAKTKVERSKERIKYYNWNDNLSEIAAFLKDG